MALTDEELQALGLDMPPPDVAMQPGPTPAVIAQPAPVQYPSSIMGDKIPQGALIPQTHDEGKQEYQQYMPKITADPGTTDYFRQRQEQLDYKAEHPWGSPVSAHPGALGSILHGLSVAGNIAGDVVDPSAMSLIPGTQLHDAALARGNEQGIQKGEEAENQATEAAAKTTQAGAEQERADTEQRKLEDTENDAANPKPQQTFEKLSDGSLVQLTTDPHTGNSAVKLLYKGDPKVETDVIQRDIDGKTHNFLVNKQTGADIKDLGEGKQPENVPHNLVVLPNGSVIEAKPGMTLPAGAQNLSGFASLNRPTTQERNVSDQAKLANEGIPGAIKEIQELKDELGPVAGRWNDFMQGKVGLDNPKFAGLRADLLMLSSAVALAHARGRLPENLREEFDRAINAPKQTPDNLVSTLQHIQPWLERASTMGQVETTPKTAKTSEKKDSLGIR
jgi:hypothetical protein